MGRTARCARLSVCLFRSGGLISKARSQPSIARAQVIHYVTGRICVFSIIISYSAKTSKAIITGIMRVKHCRLIMPSLVVRPVGERLTCPRIRCGRSTTVKHFRLWRVLKPVRLPVRTACRSQHKGKRESAQFLQGCAESPVPENAILDVYTKGAHIACKREGRR